ncbi:hypothetical protein [Nocardioides sp.]|uniref:hypothetical protein n=1 Tax=Nocardioides sp. TaxID=35761 RepID=UPI002B26CFDF|nr:hypothetical protein [Nocardioides sp.]
MALLSRTGPGNGHLLITGTGRSGTTLLVQYFAALGFDTGFTPEQIERRIDDISHAGLETPLTRDPLPYVAKSPFYTGSLGEALDAGTIEVGACIVPMRDLFSAAESRRRVSQAAADAGLDPESARGGLTFQAQKRPKKQEERLAVQFYKLAHTLVRHDVPTYFLNFPGFANGERTLYDDLEPLLSSHGVTREESAAALASVVDVGLISDFGQP